MGTAKLEAVARQKTCFVISPIGDEGTEVRKHSDMVLKHLVKKSLEVAPFNYRVFRSDEDEKPGDITVQIIQNVMRSDLVVADLTNRNPNVFYELSMCHVWQRPTVHLCRTGEKLPFDVGQLRVVFFDLGDPDSLEKAQEKIRKHVDWLENDGKIETPIQFVQGLEGLRTGQAKDEKLFDLLSKIGSSLSRIQTGVEFTTAYLDAEERARLRLKIFGTPPPAPGNLAALRRLAGSEQVLEIPLPPETPPKGK